MNSEKSKQMVATMINLNRLLCAEVVEVRPLSVANQVEVTCVTYRGGSARKAYVLDTVTGKAFEQ
jgi:hypothetical protein